MPMLPKITKTSSENFTFAKNHSSKSTFSFNQFIVPKRSISNEITQENILQNKLSNLDLKWYQVQERFRQKKNKINELVSEVERLF